jgi:hypothetical protein
MRNNNKMDLEKAKRTVLAAFVIRTRPQYFLVYFKSQLVQFLKACRIVHRGDKIFRDRRLILSQI